MTILAAVSLMLLTAAPVFALNTSLMKIHNRSIAFIFLCLSALVTCSLFSEPLPPDDPTISDDLVLWLRNPAENFSEETGLWNDVSGRSHHAIPVGDIGAAEPFVAGTVGSSSQPDIFSQDFSALAFGAEAFDLMVASGINEGEGFANVTIVGVYKRAMVSGGNTSIIRPMGIGSFIAGENQNNFDIATDPSIRKDNGNVGANLYLVFHPEDEFFIRASRMNETGIDEWFNVDGDLAPALETAGTPFTTSSDNFYLGDIRTTANALDTADIEIAEVIVYNTALEDTQIADIVEWVQENIGLDGGGDNPDMDGDGLPDVWEIENFGDITSQEASDDPDNDSLNNGGEFVRGTDPNIPDTDEDGLPDIVETGTGTFVDASDTGTNALIADTDGDTLNDNVETNTGIFVSATDTGSNPNLADSDDDGLTDNVETGTGVLVDANNTGSDPNKPDSDGDGVSDQREIEEGTDPNDSNSTPTIVVALGDDFETGDITDRWVVQHNAVGNLEIAQQGGTGIVTASGANSNGGLASISSFVPTAGGFDITFVITEIVGNPSANGFMVGIVDDNQVFHRTANNFGIAMYGQEARTFSAGGFSLIAGDRNASGEADFIFDEGEEVANQSYFDGFTVNIAADQSGWRYRIEGLQDFNLTDVIFENNGSWSDAGTSFNELFGEGSEWYLLTANQTPGNTTTTFEEIIFGSNGSSTPFQISSIELNEAATSALITWNSRPNTSYSVESSFNLENWVELDDGIESEGDETTFTDIGLEPNTPMLYYRIIEL